MVGLALARRLGVTSKRALLATFLIANLPDIDIIIGLVIHRDAWKLHGGGTHAFSFALASGALAGTVGLISASTAEGERDPMVDALIGSLVGVSHVVLDRLPYIRLSRRPWIPRPLRRQFVRMSIANWLLDTAQCFVISWALASKYTAGVEADGNDSHP